MLGVNGVKPTIATIKDGTYPIYTNGFVVTLKGLKYSLNNACLSIGHSIGISNEQISNECTIEIKDGILIVIKSKD